MKKHLLAATTLGASMIAFGCGKGSAPGTPAERPTDLERGVVSRYNETNCVDSSIWAVAQKLVDLAEGLGATASASSQCNDVELELFAGTRLGSSPGETWDYIGGGGGPLADAAVCALRDLANGPAEANASIPTVIGNLTVHQAVGYLRFDPSSKTMDGYHRVRVCAPVIGCLDAQRQAFTARVTVSDPATPAFLSSGELPIEAAYGLALELEESEQSVDFALPPISVPVPPPVLKVDVVPTAGYASALKLVDTPFDGKKVDRAALLQGEGVGPTAIHDVYGRSAGTFWSAGLGVGSKMAPNVYAFGLRNGWSSQVGLGFRNPAPDVEVWKQQVGLVNETDSTGKKTTLEVWPLRPDLELDTPRSPEEKRAVVDYHAGIRVEYDPLDLVPDAFKGFAFLDVEQSRIFAEPKLQALYASQLHMQFKEGFRRDPDGTLHSHRLEMRLGAAADGSIMLQSGVDFVVSVDLFIGKKTIVDLHPRANLELIGSGPQFSAGAKSVSALVGGPTPPGVASLTSFSGPKASPNDFINQCLNSPPPAEKKMPEPTVTPGSAEDLFGAILHPCNVCVAWYAENVVNDLGDSFVLPAGAQKVRRSDDFAEWDSKWACGIVTNGCYDLCTYEPEQRVRLKVAKSKTELQTQCGLVVK
jgi:hypothetical protein